MLSSRRLQCRPFRCSGHGSSGVILLLTGRDRPTGVLALTSNPALNASALVRPVWVEGGESGMATVANVCVAAARGADLELGVIGPMTSTDAAGVGALAQLGGWPVFTYGATAASLCATRRCTRRCFVCHRPMLTLPRQWLRCFALLVSNDIYGQGGLAAFQTAALGAIHAVVTMTYAVHQGTLANTSAVAVALAEVAAARLKYVVAWCAGNTCSQVLAVAHAAGFVGLPYQWMLSDTPALNATAPWLVATEQLEGLLAFAPSAGIGTGGGGGPSSDVYVRFVNSWSALYPSVARWTYAASRSLCELRYRGLPRRCG